MKYVAPIDHVPNPMVKNLFSHALEYVNLKISFVVCIKLKEHVIIKEYKDKRMHKSKKIAKNL